MSWWDSSSLTSFASQASQALKTAQKQIDKVLDIKEEEEAAAAAAILPPDSPTEETSSPTTDSATAGDGDSFWNAYLGSAALSPTLGSKTQSKPSRKTGSQKKRSLTTGRGFLKKSTASRSSDEGEPEDLDDAPEKEYEKPFSQESFHDSSLPTPAEDQKASETEEVSVVRPRTPHRDQMAWSDVTLMSPSSPIHEPTPESGMDTTETPNRGPLKLASLTSKQARQSAEEPGQESAEQVPVGEAEPKLLIDEERERSETEMMSENKDVKPPEDPGPSTPAVVDSTDSTAVSLEELSLQNIPSLQLTDSAVLDAKESDWSDLNVSILSESQLSTTSTISKAGSTDSHVMVEKSDLVESKSDVEFLDGESVSMDGKTSTDECGTDAQLAQGVSSTCETAEKSPCEDSEQIETSVKGEDEIIKREEEEERGGEEEEEDTAAVSAASVKTDQEKVPDFSGSCEVDITTTSTDIIVSMARTDTSDSFSSGQTEKMELSSETTDDASEGNKTLTADEFESAMSSSRESHGDSVRTEEKVKGPADTNDSGQSLDKESPETPSDDKSVETNKEDSEKGASPQSEKERGSPALSSSSYVKNMLEEAMVESLKDNESHADSQSHSSSDMVRIESGQNSGHTSGDEIETTTSSDIEIISHISTPTPNGEYRMDTMRSLDLSPLRHAFGRSHRRHSPPGHKRSDSGSSGYSLQSRNGDELLSPDGSNRQGDSETGASGSGHRSGSFTRSREALLEHAEKGAQPCDNPYDTDKLLKENNGDKLPPDVLAKKLAEMAEVLEAREKKLLQYSKENVDLVEANNIIRNQLQQSEEAREAELSDLNEVTEEFTKRLTDAEKRLQTVLREKEMVKKRASYAESELAKKSSSSLSIEKLMKEKDQQVSELLEEGEKLSKQQLQSNNIIKKLRAKEKENDSLIKTQKQKLEDQKSEIDRLEKILDAKMEVEKKQIDAINQLDNAVKKQDLQVARLKSDLEDSEEKVRSMQAALDNSYKEIGVLHKSQVAKASEAQEVALSAEMHAKEELRLAMERQQVQTQQEQQMLITQIEDLQMSMTRMEKDYGRREDILRQEISDLQQRLQEGEDRNQELTHSVSAATRPLLRQIENLQSTYAAQVSSYEKVERNLTERLSEAQTQLAGATEKERMASEQVLELSTRLASLESQVSMLRQEKSRIQAQREMERAKAELLEESNHNESAKFELRISGMNEELTQFKRDKVLLENQVEMEKMKVEAEKKKLVLAHEQLREKELQAFTRASSTPPRPQSREGEGSVMSDSLMSISQQEDLLEKSLMIASTNGNKTSLYESLRQSGASTLMENLQAQLKMREGEIQQLQSEITELERTRESMARELVNLTNINEELEQKLTEVSVYRSKFTELDQRYNALLQMYGEKVEQAQELQLDLQDVKEMYKSQIDQLLATK